MECLCEVHPDGEEHTGIEDYDAARASCVVLRDLIHPENLWPNVRMTLAAPVWEKDRPRWDITMSWNAYYLWRTGCLENLTRPLHRYLTDPPEKLHPKLDANYKEDLAEKWLLVPDEVQRMKAFRDYMGKASELLVAYWLEMNAAEASGPYSITGLAALGGPCDIAGRSRAGFDTAVEVKFAGMFDREIDVLVNNVHGGEDSYQVRALYGEWLFEKMFEAIGGLRNMQHAPRRVVAVAVEEASTYFMLLRQPISSIHEAGFWGGQGSYLAHWLAQKEASGAGLSNLTQVINELWVFKLGTGLSVDICMMVKRPGTKDATVELLPGLGARH